MFPRRFMGYEPVYMTFIQTISVALWAKKNKQEQSCDLAKLQVQVSNEIFSSQFEWANWQGSQQI